MGVRGTYERAATLRRGPIQRSVNPSRPPEPVGYAAAPRHPAAPIGPAFSRAHFFAVLWISACTPHDNRPQGHGVPLPIIYHHPS